MDDNNQRDWEARLHEATAKADEELKRLMRYLEDEVVPDVRRHSSVALRVASEKLTKLAQHLDDTKPKDEA